MPEKYDDIDSTALEEEKLRKECEKLDEEIKGLSKPTWKRPAFWVSASTAIVAIIAVLIQITLSNREYQYAENKLTLAKIYEARINDSLRVKSVEIASMEFELGKRDSIFNDSDNKLQVVSSKRDSLDEQLTEKNTAYSILLESMEDKQKDKADLLLNIDNLKKEIGLIQDQNAKLSIEASSLQKSVSEYSLRLDDMKKDSEEFTKNIEDALVILYFAKRKANLELPDKMQSRLEEYEFPISESRKLCDEEITWGDEDEILVQAVDLYITPFGNYFIDVTYSSMDYSDEYMGWMGGEWLTKEEAEDFQKKRCN